MPSPRSRITTIKEIPTIRRLVAELQRRFPTVTPSDRIYAYYDPAYAVWHISCCSYFIYESKGYKAWARIYRKKHPTVPFVFVMRYIVSSDREKLNAGASKEFFFVE